MTPVADVAIERLEPGQSTDLELARSLEALVNEVYEIAEAGLWRDDAERTTTEEIAGLIAANEIVVARRAGHGIVGTVRVHDLDDDVAEFGMLAAALDQRGLGIGRLLLDHVEQDARDRGRTVMQLELLVPLEWRHPSKEFLTAWYGRRGYRPVATSSLARAYPHLAPFLATPCELQIHRKPLR